MAGKRLPALPAEPRLRRSYADTSPPALPPVDLSTSIPISASQEFYGSGPEDVSWRTSQSEVQPAVPYLGQSFYLAPPARRTPKPTAIESEGYRASWPAAVPHDTAPLTDFSHRLGSTRVPGEGAMHRVPVRVDPIHAQSAHTVQERALRSPAHITSSKPPAVAPPIVAPAGDAWQAPVPAAPVSTASVPAAPVPAAPMPATPFPTASASAAQPVPSKLGDPCSVDTSDIRPPISATAAAGLVQPCIIIEVCVWKLTQYCDRCRWQHRATWLQTELFLTFSQKDAIDGTSSRASGGGSLASSMLIPRAAPETAGRFRIWLVMHPSGTTNTDVSALYLLWDRKQRGGFPDLAELKRLVRDKIAPEQSLGHSEK